MSTNPEVYLDNLFINRNLDLDKNFNWDNTKVLMEVLVSILEIHLLDNY